MRLKAQHTDGSEKYNIIVIDDDPGIIDTLGVIINNDKYNVTGFTNPDDALTEMKKGHFDIMILDFLLENFTGREVVEEVRKFNNEIYILLLTGYKGMAPPVETLVELDIQGYCEKNDRFDQLLLQLESAVKSIILTRKLIKFHEGMESIIGAVPDSFSFNPINDIISTIFQQVLEITKSEDGFFISCIEGNFREREKILFLKGIGKYDVDSEDLFTLVIDRHARALTEIFKENKIFVDDDMLYMHLTNEFNDESTAFVVECKSYSDITDIIRIFIVNAQATYSNAILHTIVNKKNGDLHTMVNQLEENIAKRTALEAELRQQQKMEMIGRLTGGIAHDFNNLLLIISGYSDILLNRIDKEDPNYSKISKIKIAGDRGANLIQQLMAFSRKQNLKKEPFSVNEIILPLKSMADVILGGNISFICDLQDRLWPAMVDKSQLDQVLLNLIVNARDATPGKGVITITSRNIPAESVAELHKPEMVKTDYVQLVVADTGQGISPDILPNIFEPFFTTKDQGKGTGLGLSMVYGIVKQMEGYIYAESSIGAGTTFTIYLPRTNWAKKNGEEVPVEHEQQVKCTESILVVDDEEEIKSYISIILEQEGYTIFKAKDPHHAIEIFKHNYVDLVLSDMIMPEMNGKQLIKYLNDIKPDFKFLFMSGYVNIDLVEHGNYFSRDNFIEKPFTTRMLLGKIRTVLQQDTIPSASNVIEN
jgi:signal transduction histidine kinase/DNA-binding response OmpR family regulator